MNIACLPRLRAKFGRFRTDLTIETNKSRESSRKHDILSSPFDAIILMFHPDPNGDVCPTAFCAVPRPTRLTGSTGQVHVKRRQRATEEFEAEAHHTTIISPKNI